MNVKRAGKAPRPQASQPTARTAARGRAERTGTEASPPEDGFSGGSRARRAQLSPVGATRTAPVTAARFTLERTFTLEVPEPSGLAFLGRGRGFLVVGDSEQRVFHVAVEGARVRAQAWAPEDGARRLKGLEAVAWDPEAGEVLALSEKGGQVLRMAWSPDGEGLGAARRVGRLPDLRSSGNKGWEGLAFLPAALAADGQPHLLAVHEATPRCLSVFTRDGLEEEARLDLGSIRGAPRDLSDVTVDPSTGHLFLLSDEDHCVLEMKLTHTHRPGAGGRLRPAWELVPVGRTVLPAARDGDGDRLQPEGLALDDRGDLWVAAERGQTLLHLRRTHP